MADNSALTDRQKFDRRLAALKHERDGQGWKAHWQEVSDWVLPKRGRFLSTETNRGHKLNDKIVDGTGIKAVRDAAAGLMAGITSPARPWLKLAIPDPDLMEFAPVREWMDIVTVRMLELFARSNLYNVLSQVYQEILLFGTAPAGSLEDRASVLRFQSFTAGEYFIANSDMGRANTFYREFPATVMQIVEWFVAKEGGGMDWSNASTQVKTAYDNGNTEVWIEIVNAIEPNDERIPGKRDNKNWPIRSVWYEKSDNEGKFLRRSGFKEMPIFIPRWDLTGADIYGRSPGMDALADIKMLQMMQKRKAQAIDKMVNPPMVAPTSLRNQPASVLPGNITYVDPVGSTGSQPAFRPAYEVNPRVQEIMVDIQDTRQRIREHFFADLFLMFSQSDRREITAEEIRARQEEKLLMLGPVLENVHNELLDPLVDRALPAMMRAGMLPPPPEELEGMEISVEYISILAQAQKALGTHAIESTVAFATSLMGGSHDKIDVDQAIDEYARMKGAPVKVIRSDDRVAEIRAEKAKQMQNAQNLENAGRLATGLESASKSVKNLADANQDGQVSDVMGNMQGAA